MKKNLVILAVLCFSFSKSILAQVDNSEAPITINFGALPEPKPVEKTNTPPANYTIKNPDFNVELPSLELPQTSLNLSPEAKSGFNTNSLLDWKGFGKLPPKEIKMNESTGLQRYITSQKPKNLKEFEGGKQGVFTDQDLGDLITSSEYVLIKFRDYGNVDGDIIRLIVNDGIRIGRVSLRGGYSEVRLKLKEGFNKIDFMALNEGLFSPNTAQLKIIDDRGSVLSNDQWALSTGFKATMILVKQ